MGQYETWISLQFVRHSLGDTGVKLMSTPQDLETSPCLDSSHLTWNVSSVKYFVVCLSKIFGTWDIHAQQQFQLGHFAIVYKYLVTSERVSCKGFWFEIFA